MAGSEVARGLATLVERHLAGHDLAWNAFRAARAEDESFPLPELRSLHREYMAHDRHTTKPATGRTPPAPPTPPGG